MKKILLMLLVIFIVGCGNDISEKENINYSGIDESNIRVFDNDYVKYGRLVDTYYRFGDSRSKEFFLVFENEDKIYEIKVDECVYNVKHQYRHTGFINY